MFDLLFGPLKKGKQAFNQFYIFFKVVGHVFDGMKKDVFRVRDESNVASASPAMLKVHGQDRAMPRKIGEGFEEYRTRLSMKGIMSAKAGTLEGIRLILTAFGVRGDIMPYYIMDSERWAEFLVRLNFDLGESYVGISAIQQEIQKIKEASSRSVYEVVMVSEIKAKTKYDLSVVIQVEFYPRQNLEILRLDQTWVLGSHRRLTGYCSDQFVDLYPVQMEIHSNLEKEIAHQVTFHLSNDVSIHSNIEEKAALETSVSIPLFAGSKAIVRVESVQGVRVGQLSLFTINMLDGTWLLNGERTLNGGQEIL